MIWPSTYLVICGPSFCGSTFLAYCLHHALTDVTTVGEIHWVLDKPRTSKVRILAEENLTPVMFKLVDDFHTMLKAEDEWGKLVGYRHLYPFFRERLGTRCLLTTDKVPEFVEQYAIPHKPGIIVLYKHPRDAAWSDEKRAVRVGRRRSVWRYLAIWKAMYATILGYDLLRVVIRMDDLVSSRESLNSYLHGVGHQFGLRYFGGWRTGWNARSIPFVGGNQLGKMSLEDEFFMKPVDECGLHQAEQDDIDSWSENDLTFQLLEKESLKFTTWIKEQGL